ncbi:ABC transporter permease, partial [Corynebacterium sp.]|uniref:ABC transporter permease n=1 Tax=Corynebacterium sp. TaxID=1720 RepID=UPI003736F65A
MAVVREQLGLDRGPVAIFGSWAGGILRGDLGTSWVSGKPVGPGMIQSLGVSLTLMAIALSISLCVAVLLCAPTIHRGVRGRPARGSGALAVALTALPEFLLATVFLLVGAVWLGWFPPYGWRDFSYAVLPALSLGLPAGGYLGRLLSDALADAFRERWVDTWRQIGVSDIRLLAAVTRRALPGVFSQVGLTVVGMTGGAVAVEQVFAIPGLGRATLGAAAAQDIPALQAGVLLLLALAVTVGVVCEVLRRQLLGPAHALQSAPVPKPDAYRRRRDYIVPAISGG